MMRRITSFPNDQANASELMPAGYQALSEKEKQTLRLIVRGHDAKSMARHLGLSVHTVNERLRDARRKLEVSSSRAAARLLLDTEGNDPQNLADKQLGEAAATTDMEQASLPATGRWRMNRSTGVIAGVFFMSVFVGILALSLLSQGTAPSAASEASQSAAATQSTESDAVRSARDWLELGDQSRWRDGWLATTISFRKMNTVEAWSVAAEQVRRPLGAVVSRTALSQESVPAPPAGVEVVKFRASFANRADVIETVSLVREGGDWKVAGIYVD